MDKFKKFIVVIVLLTTIGSSIPWPNNSARAQAGVFVPTHDFITDVSVKGNFLQRLFEWAQTFVLTTLKKRLLDMMVDQIIQWIQGGGKPQFVTDWKSFLDDAVNIAVGDFARVIGAGFLCSPFNLQVQISLFPVKRFSQQITCTLDQIVGNIENFYNDFRNGGWLALNASIQPRNNYYGLVLVGAEQIDKIRSSERTRTLNEALAGKGWLSTKNCREDPKTPGPDLDKDGKPNDVYATCEVTTPGDTIGGLVSEAVGSDLKFILSAEQLSDYAAAIANALINRLITEGVNGLRGVSTGSAPPGGVIGPGIGPCVGLIGSALQTCLNYFSSSGNSFSSAQANIISQIDQTLVPRQLAAASLAGSIQEIRNYENALKNLLTQFQSKNLISCPQKNTYIANINAELGWAGQTLPTLQADQAQNQNLLVQITQVKTAIQNLKPGDWTGFSNLANQVNTGGLLDFTAAQNLRDATQNQLTAIKARTSQNLQTFNQNLASCP